MKNKLAISHKNEKAYTLESNNSTDCKEKNIHLCAPRDTYGTIEASVSVIAKTWKQMPIIGE